MLSVIFGLLSAVTWGAGDFCGGLASKRSNVYSVVITSQAVGAALLLLLAFVFGETIPPLSDLGWGAGAGIAGAIGLLALYRGLASGRMGLVAPVSAVVAATLPVIAAALLEGLPGSLQLLGFGVALGGIWFLSRSASPTAAAFRLNDLGLPITAGLGFGLFFVLIAQGSGRATFWPLVAARVASLTVLTIIARANRQPIVPDRSQLGLVALSGVLDAGGNAFFSLAVQAGRLDVASVLSSLYPASTVLLAWLILKERLSGWQFAGVIATLIAIALIAAPPPALARDLEQINCRLSDLPSAGLRFVADAHQPTSLDVNLFEEAVISHTSATFNEMSLTYQTITCALVVFQDEAAADRALERVCDGPEVVQPLAPIGEEACSFGEGLVALNFRRDEALVLIKADLDGAFIYQLAVAVDERLK